MKKSAFSLFSILVLCGVLLFSSPAAAQTAGALSPLQSQSSPDFHIDQNGNATVYQAKVMLIAGTTFYARFYVGASFIRFLIKTSPDTTSVSRRYGGTISISDIRIGDTLNVQGSIEGESDSLSLLASTIVDFSNEKQIADGFTGTISGFASTTAFLLTTPDGSLINVNVGTTTEIRKGSRFLDFSHLSVGDKVTDAAGTLDRKTNILDADVVVLYIDESLYQPQNFQGTLKAVESDPAALIVTVGGADYTVYPKANAKIFTGRWKPTGFGRFLSGDTVRFYGARREADTPIIDAEVFRNLNL